MVSLRKGGRAALMIRFSSKGQMRSRGHCGGGEGRRSSAPRSPLVIFVGFLFVLMTAGIFPPVRPLPPPSPPRPPLPSFLFSPQFYFQAIAAVFCFYCQNQSRRRRENDDLTATPHLPPPPHLPTSFQSPASPRRLLTLLTLNDDVAGGWSGG